MLINSVASSETIKETINSFKKAASKKKLTSSDVFNLMTILIYVEQEFFGKIDGNDLAYIGAELNNLIIENKGEKDITIGDEFLEKLNSVFEEVNDLFNKKSEIEK